MESKKSKFKSIVYVVICMMPFLTNYEDQFITYLYLSILLLYVMSDLLVRMTIKVNQITIFCFYASIVSILMWLKLSVVNMTSVNRTMEFILLGMVVVVFANDYELKKIIKIYEVFSLFAVAFFILQVIMYFVFKKAIMLQIPFLQLQSNLENAYQYLAKACSWGNTTYVRFPGPFSEPAKYAAYVLPLFILYMCGDSNYIKKNYKRAIIIGITVLLSTSGTGIVMLLISTVFCTCIGKMNKKNILKVLVLIMLIISTFVVIYLGSDSVRRTVDNLFFATETSQTTKADYRIYRGIEYYWKLPILNKIFGIGLFNSELFSQEYNIVTQYDADVQTVEYFNGIAQILIYTGIIGSFFFFGYIKKCLKKSGELGKNMLIAYVMLITATAQLLTGSALLYLSIVLIEQKNINEKN